MDDNTTHFGFQTVAAEEKRKRADAGHKELQDLIADLDFERQLIAKSNDERALMTLEREANAIAMESEVTAGDQLVATIIRLKKETLALAAAEAE
ncbi:MAG TPA: hypothetical protein PKM39_08510, partial [Pseudothauera hydrothermalis]|nr:hypothetical protein [Pseudothauera hydrothermalis]